MIGVREKMLTDVEKVFMEDMKEDDTNFVVIESDTASVVDTVLEMESEKLHLFEHTIYDDINSSSSDDEDIEDLLDTDDCELDDILFT